MKFSTRDCVIFFTFEDNGWCINMWINLSEPIKFSLMSNTVKSRWSTVYIEGSQVISVKTILYLFL